MLVSPAHLLYNFVAFNFKTFQIKLEDLSAFLCVNINIFAVDIEEQNVCTIMYVCLNSNSQTVEPFDIPISKV